MEQFKDEIKDELAELRTVELIRGSLKIMDDDIQFYTVSSTGESGMCRNGLAKLAGVSGQALSKLESYLATKSPSIYLQPYTTQDFHLATSHHNIIFVDGKDVGNFTLYKAEYCGAVIAH